MQRLAVDQRAIHVPVDCLRRHHAFLVPASYCAIPARKSIPILPAADHPTECEQSPIPFDNCADSLSLRKCRPPWGAVWKAWPFGRKIRGSPTDGPARAGWLYYVARNTQDQIAAKLGVSRQSAQRLVSLAMSEGLIRVRVDHPIANRLDLAAKLSSRFKLDLVEVVPSSSGSPSTTMGVAEAGAAGDRAAVEVDEAGRHGDRHRPHAEGGDRAAAADGLPAAQGGFADRQHLAGWFGRVLQRHLHHGRPHQGAVVPDAAAGHLLLGRRSATCCSASR